MVSLNTDTLVSDLDKVSLSSRRPERFRWLHLVALWSLPKAIHTGWCQHLVDSAAPARYEDPLAGLNEATKTGRLDGVPLGLESGPFSGLFGGRNPDLAESIMPWPGQTDMLDNRSNMQLPFGSALTRPR